MKLGDNLTMEACNVWGNVCPRKCRPPRIGDIPKHGAVDEESPGSSTKKLAVTPLESTPEIPLEASRTTSKSAEVFHQSYARYERRRNLLSVEKEETKYFATTRRDTSSPSPSPSSIPRFARSGDTFDSSCVLRQDGKNVFAFARIKRENIVERLAVPSTETTTVFARDNDSFSFGESLSPAKVNFYTSERISPPSFELHHQRTTAVINPKTRTPSPERSPDTPEPEIREVRKDSALFLEEAEGLPTLQEIARYRSPRYFRPRRESSGYASNLGTFDEDRRNSSSIDVLQDLSSFLKERRRSSAKRINYRFGEETSSVPLERMPTTEVHRKLSSSGLEMPDIEEVREISKDDVSSVRAENLRDFHGDDVDSNFGDGECGRQTQHLRVPSDQEIPPNARYDNIKCDRSVTKEEATTPNASDPFDTTTLRKSIGEISRSNSLKAELEKRNTPKGVPYEKSTPILERSPGGPQLEEALELRSRDLEPATPREGTDKRKELRSLKVYRLLSTQSEDKVDEEEEKVNSSCFADRRISLEIRRKDDDDDEEEEDDEEKIKNSLHCANRFGESADIRIDYAEKRQNSRTNSCAIRKFSSPGEVGESLKLLGEAVGVSARPIYPYCPYSPYGSPQGSPRNRRRPLRESRRVSIDNRQGALQLNQYKLLDNIGQGSYGIVKLAYNEEDETHYAMKILSKKKLMKKAGIFGRMAPGRRGSADPLAKVYREIALLKKLDHPNVVKLLEVLDDPDEDNLYLVFELVQKGEILQIPTDKPLDEETARRNFKDVVMGVEYLHYQRIVHRDIKPSNLLVDSEGRIKIADLGVSAELRASGELLSGPAGTPAFAAPETTTPGAHYSGTLCDVWSMGVTLYSLVTGKVPWDGAGSIIAVQAAVRAEPLKFPETPILSDELRDLITRMLSKDPKERIDLQGMKEHVWLTNHGRDPLPSEGDNCRLPVTVTDEEVERVVTKVPKLDTLILIKKMLKQHSFQNPFLSRKMARALGNDAEVGTETSTLGSTLVRTTDSLSQRGATKRNAKSDRFQKAGRSNSAPDSFDWQASTRQISTESPLPPVTEASIQETEVEKR